MGVFVTDNNVPYVGPISGNALWERRYAIGKWRQTHHVVYWTGSLNRDAKRIRAQAKSQTEASQNPPSSSEIFQLHSTKPSRA